MKDIKHYLALMAILSVGVGLFIAFDYNRSVQIGITVVLAAAYVLWGVVHHTIKKEFHPRIIWEYILVALVASVVVIFVLLRA